MTQAIQIAPVGHYRVKHVVKSEVLKVLTLRSTAITVGLTVVAGLLVTGLVANAQLHKFASYYQGFDPTQNSLVGLIVAGLTGGVFRGVAHNRRVLERHDPGVDCRNS